MAQQLEKLASVSRNTFPPEADGDFKTVPIQDITEWREKLNARFGIGQGRLSVISEPSEKV